MGDIEGAVGHITEAIINLTDALNDTRNWDVLSGPYSVPTIQRALNCLIDAKRELR